MSTIFDNVSHTNASISVSSGNAAVFGAASFWTMTGATPIVMLNGSNLFRNAGQVYADAIAVSALLGNNRVEILPAGVVSSSANSAIAMAGDGNAFVNAGYVSGREAMLFSGSFNSVINTGTLVGSNNTVDFGPGSSSNRISNGGTIISTGDDAIEFEGSGAGIVDNSGFLSAERSTAILQNGTGALTITNSGTILGFDAIVAGSGADVVLNSGTISGFTLLGGGDDLFDSSRGVVNGRVAGEAGDDTLIGGASGDRLDGGSGNDILVGGDGHDVLTGGSGVDDLDGGDGRDTADYSETFAIVADLVNPDANTGNAAGDIYTSIENLTGSAGADTLFGDAGRNVLRGAGGDDSLDGRGGADVLIGGAGDDVYVVDNVRDRTAEFAAEGNDTVRSAVSYTLQNEVENLTLIGGGANDATGNSLANALAGNNAANTLAGGLGNDSLTGGTGADTFRFDTALDAANNLDTINDFLVGTDKIQLDRAIFTALTGGGTALQATRFFVGGAAHDATDRIIYNSATGQLFYDADGTGAIAQVAFAQIGPGLALAATDFSIIG